jgi:Ni,Fe-hydrogenase III large subunit
MKLLMIVHRDDAALEAFMSAVRQEKLTGFTLARSSGVGRTSQKHIEEMRIGGFLGFLTGAEQDTRLENTTLWSVVHEERLPRVLELLKQHIPDVDQPSGGLYVVLPVESFGGVE